MAVRTAFDYNNRVLAIDDPVKIRQGVYTGAYGHVAELMEGKVRITVVPLVANAPTTNVELHPRSVEKTQPE